MRLKKLVAAICFVCITLSACTFKDIKNEQAYLDLQEEKIITVYDNIVYYNRELRCFLYYSFIYSILP